MSFKKYLQSKLKKIAGISLLSALIVTLLIPSASIKADGPRFNFLGNEEGAPIPGDYELFLGRNVTRDNPNQSAQWRDPVGTPANPAVAGDEFEGQIYYHNGVVNTVAENTTIRVTIPQATTNKSATLRAAIAASNVTGETTDTVIDGNIRGLSGLTVNLNQDVQIEPVAGSVQWFPNALGNPGQAPIAPISVSMSGNELVINIGNIQGCWEFAGFVRFKFKTTPIANVTLEKTVKNVNKGTGYAENVVANANDVVEFSIATTNNGATPISDIVLKDALPTPDLTYVPGSFKHVSGSTITPLTDDEFNQLVDAGWPMGHPLNAGETHAVRFQAKAAASITAEKTVTNTATLISGTLTLTNTATVTLKPLITNIEQRKGATNTTTGKQATPKTVDGRQVLAVDASPGDEIVYSLTTISHGVAAPGYVVKDGIADILEYADITKISDSGRVVDGPAGTLEAKTIEWPAVDLAPEQPLNFTFTVRVKNPLPNNPAKGFSFDDVMYNKYGDEVFVYILRPIKKADLRIEKVVRNYTASQADFAKSNEAFPGDTLEYRINYSNPGSVSVDQVKFVDTLPPNTTYLEGTTVISQNGSIEKTVNDGIAGNGIAIATVGPGDSGYLKFKVLISPKVAASETLTNKITVTARDFNLSDIAKTTVKAKVAVPTPQAPAAPTPIVPQLPKTGAAATSSFILTFIMGIAGTYMKYRQMIGDELEIIKIASQLVG